MNGPNKPNIPDGDCADPYVRQIQEQEIFPNITPTTGINNLLPTFDLALYPNERGPYNFNTDELLPSGNLQNPKSKRKLF